MIRWIASAALLIACAATAAGAGSLRGTVRDAVSLEPLAGASVTVHVLDPDSLALPATADGEGAYEIAGIPGGNAIYVAIAHAAGHVGSYTRIEDLGARDLTYDILLAPEEPGPPPGGEDSTTVSGVILGAVAGSLAPIANASVRLDAPAGSLALQTDGAGRYATRLAVGTWALTVSAAGWRTLSAGGIAVPAEGLALDAVLGPEPLGIPEPPDGSADLQLRAIHPNPCADRATVTFTMPRAGHVSLRLFDLAGRPVAGFAERWMAPGVHHMTLDSRGVSDGVYWLRLESREPSRTRAVTGRVVVFR